MGLFSFFRKNKQESSTSGDSEFYSRAEEESAVVRGKRKPRKQSEAAVDQVLPEKKRARRRLVGAAALVLAAVIGLPMILDSEPKPLADDITIQIPSKDQPRASAAPAAANAPKVAAADALGQKEEIVDAPAAPAANVGAPAVAEQVAPARKNVDPKPSDSPVTAAADKPAPARTEPAHKSEQKPEQTLEQKPAVAAAPAGKSDDGARAAAILEGKTDIKPVAAKPASDGKSDKVVLQVAALASKPKIDELQGKLKKAGIASYTQKVATESGDRTRIRVGPFASKEEADKMRAKLAKLGLNGTVVPSNH